MHTYIYLRINDNKCPEEKQISPFPDRISKGKIEKCCQSEVVCSVGRGKTGTLWPVIEQESNAIAQFGVVARPCTYYVFFDDVAADEIGEYGRAGSKTDPPLNILFIIHQYKNDQEKVKWVP